MPQSPLHAAAVQRAVRQLRPALGQIDQDRLSALLRLMRADGRISLGDALSVLYPEAERELALAGFRQFRSRVAQAAHETGLRLTIDVDSQKRTAPSERWCWFSGDDQASLSVGEYSAIEAAPHTLGPPVAQDALVPADLRDGKPVIRYFVSYASEDRKLKEALLWRLQERLTTCREFAFDCWDDSHLLAGDVWTDKIQHAISRCHFGLLLVSYAFISKDFITRHELPFFVTPGAPIGWRRAVPVGLRPIALDGSADLKGLEALQIFRDSRGKFFSERTTDHTKDRFADELFKGILAVVRSHIFQLPPAQPTMSRQSPVLTAATVERHQHADLMAVDVDDRMVPPEGVASSLDKLKEQVAAAGVVSERRDAVEFLLEWASAPSSPPFCALLGESGIGKTVTCKMFTQRLLAAREKQPQLPLPIYLDLRHLGEVARSNPDIVTIVRTVISRSWRMPLDLDIKPEEIHHLVTEQGAIVIFDGLDEVLVQLSPIAGQQFTRELWRILHGRRRQTRRSPQGSSESASGKLLISCRTHYFRTLREQQTHLTGEDREGLWSRDYRALMLLPFRDDQIEAYLRANLPQRDVGQVRSLIASVHNLTDLAERPYTLSLLAEQIPNLERWHAQGHRISGVTLYRHVIESWLERDQGKHQIRPSHKQLLMEHFAAALWRSGKQSWIVDDLEQWLIDFLVEHPRIAAHYDMKDREVLKEDLRTATFLVRPGKSRFQFAHTSLQEFFLASYLWRALRDNRPSDWDMAVPSLETLDFLGQLLDEDGTGCFATLRAIRDEYQRGRSELALAYGLRAQAGGWPAHPLSGSHLRGADLGGYQFEGLESRMLALNEVDFTGANLSGAVFRHVVLDRTSFAHADLDAAEFMGARMRGCLFRGSSLSGTIFRDADMERSDLEAARFQRTQFLRCRISHVHGMADDKHALFALCEPETAQTHKPAAADAQLEIFTGHFGNVYDIAYSPVGQHLASAGEDGTVRVWDLKRGEELRLLRGHTDAVSTCAFSPDGRQLASAGKDGSIRLWDATTGAFVRLLSGHEGGVFRCAFSSDGRELVSVGADGSSRIWDVASAIPLRVLSLGTHDALWSVCSKDGRYVASVAEDGTVRLWNTRNGDVRVVLRKRNEKDSDEVYPQALSADSQHLATSDPEGRLAIWDIAGIKPVETRLKQTSIVTASAFSSDGHLFLAAQDNGDIRLWNTATGQLLFDECQDLHAIPACAFAPNGGQFATGAENGTLRLYAPGFMGEVVRVCEGTDRVNACNLSPDGRCLASALDDGSVRVIDALAGKPRLVLLRPDRAVVSCVFSPDGRQLASSDDDGFVVLWCRETGEQLRTLDISDHGYVTDVNDCAFLPDNRHIVAIESDGTVSIWDTQQAVRVRVVSAENVVRFSCVISPDGERIAWVGEDEFLSTLNLTDASTYHFPMHGNGVAACAFSPDGRYVISACTDGSLHIWDSVNMELRRTWQAHDDLASLCAFSADGRIVASHGRDGMLALWDSTTGERLRSLQRAQQSLSHCSFSPDGRLLVFVEGRTIVHRWDLSSGRLLPLIRHLPEGELVLISEDGSIAGATANAWRWIGWAAPDPRTGELTRYPAEIFGPLPLLRTPTKHD